MSDAEDEPLINISGINFRHNVVRISPIKSVYKPVRLQVCVGSSIAAQLGWKAADQISVEANSSRKFILLKKIHKNTDDCSARSIRGYKFMPIPRTYSYSLSLPSGLLPDDMVKIKTATHEIIEEDGKKYLKVYLKEGQENDKQD